MADHALLLPASTSLSCTSKQAHVQPLHKQGRKTLVRADRSMSRRVYLVKALQGALLLQGP